MYYGYDICPRCKDGFIERVETKKRREYFENSGGNCKKCGSKLKLACTGERKRDETIYKIHFCSTVIEDKEKCKQCIMEISNCSADIAEKKLSVENSLLFEGGLFQTYLCMELLDKSGIIYNVNPEFPLERRVYFECENCGCEANYVKEETIDVEGYIKQGWFCEHCNEWVAFNYISKIAADDVDYRLKIFLENVDSKMENDIKEMIEELMDKKTENNNIIVCDKAENIHSILEILVEAGIKYDIVPFYPHEIVKHSKIDENFLNEILEWNKNFM